MKRHLLLVTLAVLLASLVLGCGSAQDKGINSNRDRPTAAPSK